MLVSRERLKSVDEELAQLGKSEEEIAAVLARFAAASRPDLDEVDAELAELVEGRADLAAILETARSEVSSALEAEAQALSEAAAYVDAEVVAADEEGEEALAVDDAEIEDVAEEDLTTVGGSMEPIRVPEEEAAAIADASAVDAMLDEIAESGPEGDTSTELGTLDEVVPAPNSPLAIAEAAAAQADGLSVEDLFGDDPFATEAAEEGNSDLSDLFYANQLTSMAELPTGDVGELSEVLEAERRQREQVHPIFDDEHEGEVDDATTVFSPDEAASLEGAGESEAPAALAALDELLDDEFELLVDADILEEEDVPIQAKSAIPPPPPGSLGPSGPAPDEATEAVHIDDPYAEGQALDEEDEDEEEAQKGFFKKLFGSKKPPK